MVYNNVVANITIKIKILAEIKHFCKVANVNQNHHSCINVHFIIILKLLSMTVTFIYM